MLNWTKGSNSVPGDCPEVAFLPTCAMIRNSNVPGSCVLVFPREAWEHFVTSVKAGEMDMPNGQ